MRMTGHPDGEAAILRAGPGDQPRELRFAPRGELSDLRGRRWSVEGDRGVLGLEERDGVLDSERYPDALGRVWDALRCRTAGEVLVSAEPGYEFVDWGGAGHVGGGSHGSLHANDSHGALLWCGTGPEAAARGQWTLRDIAPMIDDHFGVEAQRTSPS